MALLDIFKSWQLPLAPGRLSWQCNLCNQHNESTAADMGRESGNCSACGSTLRLRMMLAVLSRHLFGDVRIWSNVNRMPDIKGLGMSDSSCFSELLASRLDYVNTFYHCEPKLDIQDPDPRWLGVNDFVISSDVFEHVLPPIQQAFDKLCALLKPGGVVVFSVPFSLEEKSREHYPNLHDFSIYHDDAGEWKLANITRDGVKEEFGDLVFHGGPGSTLELRLFSLKALKEHFLRAGFKDITVHAEPYFEYGIFWLHPWSLIISAIKA